MIPNEICHFTKTEIAIENILSEKRLWIGQLKFTNDPRESRPKEPILFHRNDLPINSNPKGNKLKSERYSQYQRVQLNEWKVLCVTLHKPKRKINDHDADIYNSNILLGYSNPALWAHYAENHKGVCLIFSGKILHQNIQNELGNTCKIFDDKVKYSANRDLIGPPMLSVKNMDIDIQETVSTHFYTY